MKEHVGTNFTDKDVSDYLWSTLKSGRVVPGYGHAVLRKPDPRFEALMDYASSRPEIAQDPVFQLVKKNSEIAPEVLKEHGKTKVRFPNRQPLYPILLRYYEISLFPIAASYIPLTTRFYRTHILMSIRALAFYSIIMDSTRHCTILPLLVSAVASVHWHS